MKHKFFTISKKFRPGHLLAILFLGYMFYVGSAAIPQFISNTTEILKGQHSLRSYIRQVNDQYDGMLETDSRYPLLQNKGTYIDLNGLMANILGQPMMNDRIILKNGHLTSVEPETADPEEIRQNAENIIRFCNTHTAGGGKFLFVMAPSQISKYEDLLPSGYTDTANATADAFLDLLKEAGVPYLDLRESLQSEGISYTDAYFTTDHHWTPQTAFWAYGKILEKLEQIQAIDPIDPFYTDPKNYTFEVHRNAFLGSSGRRTGIYYAGLDDAILLKPNFDTNISVSIPDRPISLQGRYEDVSYNTDVQLNYLEPDFYNEDCYGLYGWGDTPITHWRNEQAPVQGKFLLIGESFGNIPFSLMSISFSSCDEVDLRHYTGDLRDHYSAYAPDTVIMEVTVNNTLSKFTAYPYP